MKKPKHILYDGLDNEDIFKKEIAKYDIILDVEPGILKEKLSKLCQDYYLGFVSCDKKLFNESLAELQKYLKFNIDPINDYVKYALIVASNNILKKLYNFDFDLYAPGNPQLILKSRKETEAEQIIKNEGLTSDDVDLIKEYNKQCNDIYCLTFADVNLYNKLKPQIELPKELKESTLIYINYNGDDIETDAKLFYAMDIGLVEGVGDFLND